MKNEKRYKILDDVEKDVSCKLMSLVSFPSKVSRRPRTLDMIDDWKASECLNFVLYVIPFVFAVPESKFAKVVHWRIRQCTMYMF